jgi:ubiquinone/menaquinone biosynthesis C-methylase UbiE/uncharacterized protein YbaR (Trm112 family)
MGGSLRLGAPELTGLVCPACREPLHDVTCASCGERYAVEDGIAMLLPPGSRTEAKERQAAWFDAADAEYEIERPAGTPAFHAWLLREKFRRGTSELARLLPGASALAVCGGSGLDAELLARAGARATSADVSLGASRRVLARARRHGVQLTAIVADAEALPYADRSIDIVYVHDGLHHVDRPLAALAEMARVARLAVSVNEPARAAATRLAVRGRLAHDHEEAGNAVRRLTLEEVTTTLRDRGFRIARAERYAMVYRHEAGAVSRLLSRPHLMPIAARAVRGLDPLGARVGNKLTVQAVRE